MAKAYINMIGDGMTKFVEFGHGQVLTGLIERIQKSLGLGHGYI